MASFRHCGKALALVQWYSAVKEPHSRKLKLADEYYEQRALSRSAKVWKRARRFVEFRIFLIVAARATQRPLFLYQW